MSAILRVRDENGNVHDIPAIVGPPGPQGPPGPAGSGGSEVVKVTIPKGRMRGDVDGDGYITLTDQFMVLRHFNNKEQITDEIALWCADINADSKINATDNTQILRYYRGLTNALTTNMADYYGVWTFEKLTNARGRFYTDIACESVTAQTSAVITVGGSAGQAKFISAECGDGTIRVYAEQCPIADITATVECFEGDGSATIVCASPLSVRTYFCQFVGTGWAADDYGYMTQTVAVDGMKAGYHASPIFAPSYIGTQKATDEATKAQYDLVGFFINGNNSLTAYCLGDAPTASFYVMITTFE